MGESFAKMYILAIMCRMKYPVHLSFSCPKVCEMPSATATELKNSTADILDRVTCQGALAVTRHNKPRAVLLPIEQYEQLVGGEEDWLADLKAECQDMLRDMQDPKQKAGARHLFEATPEELGAAAVRGAQQKRKNGCDV